MCRKYINFSAKNTKCSADDEEKKNSKFISNILNKRRHESRGCFKGQLECIQGTGIAVLGSLFIITAAPLIFGLYYMTIKGLKGESVEIADVLWGFGKFLRSWALVILMGIAIFIGLIFLIVPGLALIVLLQYSIPLVILKDYGAVEALKKSFSLAKSNFTFSVLVAATSFVVNFVGGAFWIGWLISVPFTTLLFSRAAVLLIEKETPVASPPSYG